MRVIWHVLGRLYETRAERAFKRFIRLKDKAEKFFARVGGLQ